MCSTTEYMLVNVLSRSVMSDFVTPMDYSPSGSSAHEIFQARILEWGAISYHRGSSQPRHLTHISCVFCIGRWKRHLGALHYMSKNRI